MGIAAPDLLYTCDDGSTPDNGGGLTFSRSMINDDEYASLHPPCGSLSEQGCDTAVYLNGNPFDGTFESGDQGYNMLHEETATVYKSLHLTPSQVRVPYQHEMVC